MSREEGMGANDDRETDFGVLNLDLSLKEQPCSKPNPLYAAPDERLEPVRRAVRSIVAARRAGVAGRRRRKR